MSQSFPTDYWHRLADGRIQCDLCPRYCKLREGQRGLCYVRGCESGQIVLHSYGRSSGFCIDPIEKKPLNHFYPGSSVLSFGTAGCNLACKFCQNWDMSKSREMDTLADAASPEDLARVAAEHDCRSIAFTYNDPVIFLEYAEDVALACKSQGIKSVAVTAGYICDQPRERFFRHLDAANVDLKAFSQDFYKKLCGAELETVKETLRYLVHETSVWTEVTTLLIPDANDSETELQSMTDWFAEYLGPNVPLHFSAFHPDWKMKNVPATPLSTLKRAREIALSKGLHYVYTGNVYDPEGDTTYCPGCSSPVIERDRYELRTWHLDVDSNCRQCGHSISGEFEASPGTWGRHRQVLNLSNHSRREQP